MSRQRPSEIQQLESRALLTALVINNSNVDDYVNATTGTVEVDNLDLGTNDSLVIERLTLNAPGQAISINLNGIPLERLAIETIEVSTFTGTAIDVNLTNVTGLRTIAIEDVRAESPDSNDLGLRVNLNNTNTHALTIEDSSLAGIVVDVNNNSVVTHGVITENRVNAPAGNEAIQLDVRSGGRASDFHIVNNTDVSALDRDAIRLNLTDAPTDGLVIDNNVIGNEPGANVFFRAEGDTFIQPFQLRNDASDGELLQQFVFDLRPLGLVFDTSAATGKPFTAQVNAGGVNTGTLTGITSTALSSNNQVLTVNFNDFAPGETLLFVIDVDNAPLVPGDPPQDFSAFGRDLIGAEVTFNFGAGANSGPKSVRGLMVGDADVFNASEFARGNTEVSDVHGINLNLNNSPVTNARISSNEITGVAGHGVRVNSANQSDLSAIIRDNTIRSGGQDGIHFDLLDSNFTGAILDNAIGGNTGHGVAFVPKVSRTGLVEAAVDSNPVVITSTNHQLQTGDQIIIQGMVNDNPDVNHPANGLRTVTRIDNNRFSLQGISGLPANVVYAGGGSWYMPNFQTDGTARGLVEIDVQSTEPQGRIRAFQNVVGDVQVTSLAHGLATGDRVRIEGAAGTGISGTSSFKITVIDADTFSLDGVSVVGPYDTTGGLATWTKNIVENATVSAQDEIIITSQNHDLVTGDQIRVVGMTITEFGETRESSGNGLFTVTKLTNDTFLLQGSVANGIYTPGSGYWIPFSEAAFDGRKIPQIVSGNTIDGNGKAGFYVDLSTGTRFDGDFVENTVSGNQAKGIHIESHSFGLGLNLPLDPTDPVAVPDVRDVSFNVNIGTAPTDGNDISSNQQAGIVIEALDFATGSFEINGNRINSNATDDNSQDPFDRYMGDGIVVRLDSDRLTSESVGFLTESIIANNQIGVDARGNQGNGLSFSLTDRTKIQDLEVNNNSFLNSGLDGFHFVRTEDGDLNSVIFDGNDATNNAGDGFDIFAQNTVKDQLDFFIRNSNVDNNREYGIRVDVQADARVSIDMVGSNVRQNGIDGGGFNPNDNAGAGGQSGGIGIHGFQQVNVDFKADDVQILDNFGDGFSVDADNYFDAVTVNTIFTDTAVNGNTLTGLRSVGAAFGSFEWHRSDFIGNGTDGVRIISNVDPDDFFNRRVGGQDIDVFGLGNNFQLNGQSGVVLGMGVSAVFGNGDPTEDFANEFGGTLDEAYKGRAAGSAAGNEEDGLKIVQEAGPYLRESGRRRLIETDGNVFTFNEGDGVDIGHFVATEGGNVLHGEEVISDVDVVLSRADISDNLGDGVEWLADSVFRIPPVPGGGQDNLPNLNISSLSVTKSTVKDNIGRGVDILNRRDEDSRITLLDNEIIGNGLVGIYVVNTSTHDQRQSGPEDPLTVDYGGLAVNTRDPNIELRVQDNLIESNGTAARQTLVPINDSNDARDDDVLANPDFHHLYNLIQGTIGGLVIRVGTSDSIGWGPGTYISAPNLELGLAGVDAEVWKNSFDGNFGADVYFDNFVSAVPNKSTDIFDINTTPTFRWFSDGPRDPLSRLDLSFRENDGNSIDVINGFAFLDNNDPLFKSRIRNGTPAPNDDGPFTQTDRQRNATRTLGYHFPELFENTMGQVPGIDIQAAAPGGLWSYDGWGTSTWRVESDFDFNNFDDTSTIFGLSDFFDIVNLNGGQAEQVYQWDTGVNVPGFVGATPYSLQRGDIFNVQLDEAPIAPDQLEENDSFLGATQLKVDPITGLPSPLGGAFSVNSLTTDGILNIERKGDRDYYSLVAAGTGPMTVNLGATDLLGDRLQFLVYEVDPSKNSSEVPMVRSANGVPLRTTVNRGTTGVLTVNVTAGRTYIIEVISNEQANYGSATNGKNFEYGTVRNYSLSLTAPVGPVPVFAAPPVVVTQPTVTVASSPGFLAAASVAGQNPRLDSLTNVSPDPISTSVNTLTLVFTEDVTGVDISDFELKRNGVVLDTSGLLINPVDAMTYEVTNLSTLTAEAGTYEFSLIVAGSNIVDTDLAPLAISGNEVETWVLNNTVDYFLDTPDNIPGDRDFADVNGNRSLRAAINEANAHPGTDIIELAPGTYLLSLAERFEDEGFSGDLDIRESVTIRGKGATASDTVIDAAQVDRVFHVFPGVELILQNLTIQGGEAYDGAGILIEGTRTPAGLSSQAGGMVRLTDVNVINNEAYNQGGGIYNLGTLTTRRTSISMNDAGSRGGGIFNHGRVDMINTTVSTNFAVSRGGGIYNEVRNGAVNLAAAPIVTVSELRAINSTIAFNHAESTGGGLFQEGTSRSILGNTIIDQNTALASPDLFNPVNSLGTNFVGNLGDGLVRSDLSLLASDAIADPALGIANAGLSPLTANVLISQNATWVHPLTSVSYAVDKGTNATFATAVGVANTSAALIDQKDQRTSGRLVEGDNDGIFTIDMGAFEYFVSQPVAIIFATPNPAGANELVNFDATGSTHSLVPGLSRIVLYEWDFNYDGANFVPAVSGSTATTASHIYVAEGTYLAALRVTDDTGATDIETIVINVSAPSAPVITLPFAGGTSDSTPVIAWTAGTGQFSLTVTNLGTGAVVINETGLTDKQYTPTIQLPPGLYQAVVTATNLSGSESSVPYDFEVIKIAFTDPLNLDIEFDTTPEFTFTAIPDADRYQIWVNEVDPATGQSIGIRINDAFINAATAQIPGTELATYEPGAPLPEGRYRVWVRAFDVDGNAGDWSDGSTFSIERPVITGPVFGTRTTIDNTPTITWTDLKANQYQVWLTQIDGTTANGTVLTAPQLIVNTVVSGLSYTPPALGNGNFRVWVRAVDDNGEAGLWSFQYNFTKDLTIGPDLISPINLVNTTDRTPVFTWEALEGATHYELWVNSSRGIQRIIHNNNIPHVQGASTITYTDPSVVLTNAVYRWWVRAFNEEGAATGWSNSETFFVPVPVITQPSPAVPGGIAVVVGTNLPTFTWTGVPEYVRYEVWVNNLTTGQSRVINDNNVLTTSYTATLPLENGTFRLWVRGFDADGNASQWSNAVDFSLDATISNAPFLVFPDASFIIQDNTPAFEWTAVPNVTSYEILVKDMLKPDQPTVLSQTMTPAVLFNGNLTFSPTNNLLSGTYRWWIRGLNADGNPGPWSQPLDFRVASNDLPVTDESLLDELPVLLAGFSETEWSDDLHSITVHPAAVVVATTVPAVEDAVVEVGGSEQTAPVDSAFDSVMEELATADWWTLDADLSDSASNSPVAVERPVAVETVATPSASSSQRTAASALGLAVAAMTGRRRSRNQEDE
ncbi:MAG: PKD domain-containing protein [Planctomycetaceae bacterium]